MIVKAYEFSIVASGLSPAAEDFADRFFNAGCDDAAIAFQKGHIVLDFAREAESMGDAIASAVAAVEAAGAKVERIEPDPLVNLSDIAARCGLTRAALTQYAKGQRSRDFPAPSVRVTSDSPLWDWAKVARWLYAQRKLSREAAVEAEAVRLANTALAAGDRPLAAPLAQRLRAYEQTLEAA
ncbi:MULTISPECIES: helix-turn-helix transcriptional regulator [Rhodopseudomonas]|uniref:helix-turn-helix transcriptional regulator n=1 Tax=Rhodopseudomonas TaxID=1073 RepID=UPI001FCF1443|nr:MULTISPECIES: hypothetical protein [Rhodopseudomonas]